MSNQPAPPVSPNDTRGQTGGQTDLLQEDGDMAQHTRAHRSDSNTAARIATPAGPGAPAAPDHDLDGAPGQPGQRRDRVPLIAGVILGLVLIGIFMAVYLINRPQNAQTPQTAPPPAAASTSAPATATTPAVAPSTAAYAAAEKTYRAWEASYAAAMANFQADKLDASLVTPETLAKAKGTITTLSGGGKSTGSARYTQDIKSITGADYTSNSLTLRVCGVSDLRFFDASGKDVTLLPDRSPAPLNTAALANNVKLASSDAGKTWQVASLTTEREPGAGSPC